MAEDFRLSKNLGGVQLCPLAVGHFKEGCTLAGRRDRRATRRAPSPRRPLNAVTASTTPKQSKEHLMVDSPIRPSPGSRQPSWLGSSQRFRFSYA